MRPASPRALAAPQSFAARHPSAMPRRSARAPRLISLATILLFSTVLFSQPATSQTTHQFVVCKELHTLVCVAWPIDYITPTETKDLYETDGRKCGLSDLKPISPHRRFIAVKWFNERINTKVFCKVTKVRVIVRPALFDMRVNRVRRQTGYHPRGRYRGQTQSQYLSIDRGNAKDEGKAEAHSAADSSRAIVSGNSGMGQAQSQTIYDPSCEDCLDRSDIDVANLSYKPGKKITGGNGKAPGGFYGPVQTNGGTYGHSTAPGGSYGNGQTPGGTNVPGHTTGGSSGPGQLTGGTYAPGQSPGRPGQSTGGTYEPGQSPGGTYGPSQTPGGTYGLGQSAGGNRPGQSPGGTNGQSQSPGGAYGPDQSPGGSYGPGQPPGGQYGPVQTPGGSYSPGQTPGGLYGPGQSAVGANGAGQGPGQSPGVTYGPGQSPGGTYGPGQSPVGSHGPGQTAGGLYGSGQAPGGPYGPGQSPGGTYGPSQTGGGTYGPGQTAGGANGPGQSPSGTYRPGQTSGGQYGPGQIPEGTYGPGRSPEGSYGPGQTPRGPYGLGQSPGGAYGPGQSPGGSYGSGQSPGGAYGPGQSPGGSYGPGQSPSESYGPGQTPGGTYGPVQIAEGTNGPGQTPERSNGPGQQSGGTYGPGQSPGGSYGTGQLPGESYGSGQIPGGYGPGQTIGGTYGPGQTTGGANGPGTLLGTYGPGQQPGGTYSQGAAQGGTQGFPGGSSTPGQLNGNQKTGPAAQPGIHGSNVVPEQNNGINWPLLSSLLPAASPGSTYFCCIVSPGSNARGGSGPSNTYFGVPGSGDQNFGSRPFNLGTTGSNNGINDQRNLGSMQPGNKEIFPHTGQNLNKQYGATGQISLPTGSGVPSNLQAPSIPYGLGNQNNLITGQYGPGSAGQNIPQNLGGSGSTGPNGPYGTGNVGQNIPYGSATGQSNHQSPNAPIGTSGQNAPLGTTNTGHGGITSPGSYGLVNAGPNAGITPGNRGPNGEQYIPSKTGPNASPTIEGTYGSGSTAPFGTGNVGQNEILPTGQYVTTNGQNSILPSGPYSTATGQNPTTSGGPYNTGTGQNSILPNGPYGNTAGQNSMLSSGPYGTGNAMQPNAMSPAGQYGTPTGQNTVYGSGGPGQNTFSNTPYGTGNGDQYNPQITNGIGNGVQGSGITGPGRHNLIPNNLQTSTNQFGQNGPNLGTNGAQPTQYGPGIAGQINPPNLGGSGSTGSNGPYGTGNVGQFINGQTGTEQNNLMPPLGYGTGGGQNNYQPGGGMNNQQRGISGVDGGGGGVPGSYQQNFGQINGNGGGARQNVGHPNSVSSSFDDYDSEAQASVAQAQNGTTALATSKGGNKNGRAQTQVEGTYTGTGSFSANAEISDENKAAQSHVSGSKKGASSSAEGRGRKNKSQASVNLGSETGSILTDSQSSGDMHSSSSQVQGSVKGGMADAQAKGTGSTSSQAQIGFTPYKEEDKSKHDGLKRPFEGAGSASAQTSGRMGTSQSQLRGTFKYGITYNGAAQAGSSLDKDTVFSNLLPFDKINVFDDKDKNINIETTGSEITEKPKEIAAPFTEKSYEPSTTKSSSIEEDISEHSHSDHHKTSDQPNSTTRPPPEGNRRSFTPNYNTNGGEYEYPTDKDDNQQEDYDIDDGFGSDAAETGTDQNEYPAYDELNRDTENTHQSLLSPSKKGLEVKQSTGGNTQHIILGSLNNHDARVTQKNSEHPDESKIYQPGERVPGMGGYTIPAGFTGSVKSVASKEKTYVVGSKYSPSQAQTVTLTPGTGKVKYVYPNQYGQNVNPKDLRSLYNSKADDNRYVSVSKSVTRDLDNENNIRRQYSHTYYTKSSSCGYFTFTCTMVSSAEGKKKVCKPKIPTNPDGTPMRC